MDKNIRYDRVVWNILFFIFYLLLASLIFSFIFPLILIILRQDILNPNSPVFNIIQIIIWIIVLIFTIVYRKYFYLPIVELNIKLGKEIK